MKPGIKSDVPIIYANVILLGAPSYIPTLHPVLAFLCFWGGISGLIVYFAWRMWPQGTSISTRLLWHPWLPLEEAARDAYEKSLPAQCGNLAFSAQSYAKSADEILKYCAGILLHYVKVEGQPLGSRVWHPIDADSLARGQIEIENGKAVLREQHSGRLLGENLRVKKSDLAAAIRRMSEGLGPAKIAA